MSVDFISKMRLAVIQELQKDEMLDDNGTDVCFAAVTSTINMLSSLGLLSHPKQEPVGDVGKAIDKAIGAIKYLRSYMGTANLKGAVMCGEIEDTDTTIYNLERALTAKQHPDAELLEAAKGIIEIGKRDLTNEKYNGYFDALKQAITRAEKKVDENNG